MPLNSEALPTTSREEFCLALRAARERRGITLHEIAEATKIPASLFAELERNDLRHWPHGLFRRSFFRDYASMIGLPATEACADFVRLFIDGTSVELAQGVPATAVAEVRLVLDEAWHGPRSSVGARLTAALIDAGLVVLGAFALAWGGDLGLPVTIALVALTYFSIATAWFGKSPASWAIAKGKSALGAPMQGLTAVAAAMKHVFGAAGSAAEPGSEPQMHAWVTDARRVAPARSPRFRARIKLPQ